MSTQNPVKVRATLQYCYHNRKADLSNKFEVTLANLSDAATAKLGEMGIEVKTSEKHPEWGNYIIVRSNYEIPLTDSNGEELGEDVKVGNGSKAEALVDSYEWAYKKKTGVSPSVVGIVVTDLIRYESNADRLRSEVPAV